MSHDWQVVICLALLLAIVVAFPLLIMWHVNRNDPRRGKNPDGE